MHITSPTSTPPMTPTQHHIHKQYLQRRHKYITIRLKNIREGFKDQYFRQEKEICGEEGDSQSTATSSRSWQKQEEDVVGTMEKYVLKLYQEAGKYTDDEPDCLEIYQKISQFVKLLQLGCNFPQSLISILQTSSKIFQKSLQSPHHQKIYISLLLPITKYLNQNDLQLTSMIALIVQKIIMEGEEEVVGQLGYYVLCDLYTRCMVLLNEDADRGDGEYAWKHSQQLPTFLLEHLLPTLQIYPQSLPQQPQSFTTFQFPQITPQYQLLHLLLTNLNKNKLYMMVNYRGLLELLREIDRSLFKLCVDRCEGQSGLWREIVTRYGDMDDERQQQEQFDTNF